MKKYIPNTLTILRGVLILFIIPLFFLEFPYKFQILYGIFIVASTTDFLDGYLARKWNVVSEFGKMFDPLMDKILTIVLFFLFIPFDILPTWIFILFIVRDLWVDGIKNFMLSRNIITPAVFLGKLKFFCVVLLFHFAFLLFFFPENTWIIAGLWISAFIGLIASYGSGIFYTKKFISFFKNE